MLLQAGLDEIWWAESMECVCYLRNVQDFLADGKIPYEIRFGETFKGPMILFFLEQWLNIIQFQFEISQDLSIWQEGVGIFLD